MASAPRIDIDAARRALARKALADFAGHVVIRSDDPLNPAPAPMVPYPYQADLGERWQRRESMVILKSRQIGCSVWLRAYAAWRAWAHGWAVGYYSRGQAEAVAWLDGVEAMLRELPASWGVETRRRGELLEVGTGSIRAHPSTPNAGIGYTYQLVIADEAAHHEYGAENYANYAPTFSAGGQYICLSTADPGVGASGWFYRLWRDAETRAVPYSPVFLPWHVRTGRDAEWLAAERRKLAGQPHAFLANYPEYPDDAFQSPSGLVYGVGSDGVRIYDRVRNVRPAARPWGEMRWRIAGVDPGGSDPTGLVAVGCEGSTGRAHVFDAVRLHGMVSAMDIAGQLQQWQGLDAVIVDGAASGMIGTLRALGYPAYAARKDRGMGRGMVAQMLTTGLLTVEPGLSALDEEFLSYWWVERRDGQRGELAQATRTGAGHHADLLDALRYAAVEAVQGAWNADATPKEAARYDHGIPQAKAARESLAERLASRRREQAAGYEFR